MKIQFWFLLFLFDAAVAIENGTGICNIEPTDRDDCGWPGINQTTCQGRGCCWNETVANETSAFDIPWCYYNENSSKAGICNVQETHLVDCGWLGIDQTTCEMRGCCWNSSVAPGKPWCYVNQNGAVPTCIVGPDFQRTDCGWFGIDQQTCERRGCCWDDSDQNKPFCFVKENSHLPHGLCPVAPSDRQECGYFGITKEQCLDRTCCWDDTVEHAKYCFHQPSGGGGWCYIYHGVYGSCNYVCNPDQKIAYGLCSEGRNCCYDG